MDDEVNIKVGSVIQNPYNDVSYKIIRELGRGAFGVVFSVECSRDGNLSTAALKVTSRNSYFHQQGQIEADILKRIHEKMKTNNFVHSVDLITHILDEFSLDGRYFICIPLYGLNLYEYIKSIDFVGCSIWTTIALARQLALGLHAVSASGVIHADIKPENILLPSLYNVPLKEPLSRQHLSIIDFGSSSVPLDGIHAHPYLQSRYYRCPEVLLGIPFTSQADVWSFGCVLFELLIGLPFVSGTSEIDCLRQLELQLGHPPDWLIALGKKAPKMYRCTGTSCPPPIAPTPQRELKNDNLIASVSAILVQNCQKQYSVANGMNVNSLSSIQSGTCAANSNNLLHNNPVYNTSANLSNNVLIQHHHQQAETSPSISSVYGGDATPPLSLFLSPPPPLSCLLTPAATDSIMPRPSPPSVSSLSPPNNMINNSYINNNSINIHSNHHSQLNSSSLLINDNNNRLFSSPYPPSASSRTAHQQCRVSAHSSMRNSSTTCANKNFNTTTNNNASMMVMTQNVMTPPANRYPSPCFSVSSVGTLGNFVRCFVNQQRPLSPHNIGHSINMFPGNSNFNGFYYHQPPTQQQKQNSVVNQISFLNNHKNQQINLNYNSFNNTEYNNNRHPSNLDLKTSPTDLRGSLVAEPSESNDAASISRALIVNTVDNPSIAYAKETFVHHTTTTTAIVTPDLYQTSYPINYNSMNNTSLSLSQFHQRRSATSVPFLPNSQQIQRDSLDSNFIGTNHHIHNTNQPANQSSFVFNRDTERHQQDRVSYNSLVNNDCNQNNMHVSNSNCALHLNQSHKKSSSGSRVDFLDIENNNLHETGLKINSIRLPSQIFHNESSSNKSDSSLKHLAIKNDVYSAAVHQNIPSENDCHLISHNDLSVGQELKVEVEENKLSETPLSPPTAAANFFLARKIRKHFQDEAAFPDLCGKQQKLIANIELSSKLDNSNVVNMQERGMTAEVFTSPYPSSSQSPDLVSYPLTHVSSSVNDMSSDIPQQQQLSNGIGDGFCYNSNNNNRNMNKTVDSNHLQSILSSNSPPYASRQPSQNNNYSSHHHHFQKINANNNNSQRIFSELSSPPESPLVLRRTIYGSSPLTNTRQITATTLASNASSSFLQYLTNNNNNRTSNDVNMVASINQTVSSPMIIPHVTSLPHLPPSSRSLRLVSFADESHSCDNCEQETPGTPLSLQQKHHSENPNKHINNNNNNNNHSTSIYPSSSASLSHRSSFEPIFNHNLHINNASSSASSPNRGLYGLLSPPIAPSPFHPPFSSPIGGFSNSSLPQQQQLNIPYVAAADSIDVVNYNNSMMNNGGGDDYHHSQHLMNANYISIDNLSSTALEDAPLTPSFSSYCTQNQNQQHQYQRHQEQKLNFPHFSFAGNTPINRIPNQHLNEEIELRKTLSSFSSPSSLIPNHSNAKVLNTSSQTTAAVNFNPQWQQQFSMLSIDNEDTNRTSNEYRDFGRDQRPSQHLQQGAQNVSCILNISASNNIINNNYVGNSNVNNLPFEFDLNNANNNNNIINGMNNYNGSSNFGFNRIINSNSDTPVTNNESLPPSPPGVSPSSPLSRLLPLSLRVSSASSISNNNNHSVVNQHIVNSNNINNNNNININDFHHSQLQQQFASSSVHSFIPQSTTATANIPFSSVLNVPYQPSPLTSSVNLQSPSRFRKASNIPSNHQQQQQQPIQHPQQQNILQSIPVSPFLFKPSPPASPPLGPSPSPAVSRLFTLRPHSTTPLSPSPAPLILPISNLPSLLPLLAPSAVSSSSVASPSLPCVSYSDSTPCESLPQRIRRWRKRRSAVTNAATPFEYLEGPSGLLPIEEAQISNALAPLGSQLILELFIDLLQGCLKWDPRERLTIDEILTHPILCLSAVPPARDPNFDVNAVVSKTQDLHIPHHHAAAQALERAATEQERLFPKASFSTPPSVSPITSQHHAQAGGLLGMSPLQQSLRSVATPVMVIPSFSAANNMSVGGEDFSSSKKAEEFYGITSSERILTPGGFGGGDMESTTDDCMMVVYPTERQILTEKSIYEIEKDTDDLKSSIRDLVKEIA